MDFENNIKKYAAAIAHVGINVQKDDHIVINTDSDSLPVARELSRELWRSGAADVLVKINDAQMELIKLSEADSEALAKIGQFKIDYAVAQMEEKYHRISLAASAPGLLNQIDQDRLQSYQKTNAKMREPLQKYMDGGEIKWVVAGTASPYWAKQLFPELTQEEAIEKLWQLIFATCRIDREDPIAAWQEHDQALKDHERWLDDQNFEYLMYQAPGTDLTVYLAENHKWVGGSSETPDGIKYMANMPTEEIFTTPHKYKVDGYISSTKPLSALGKIIENFKLTFKDGKVVDYEAEKNADILKILMETDEGAIRLGEIAIVPHSSPISQMNVLFKSTLYDENASCHFALGQSYAETIKDGARLSDAEKDRLGANQSLIHVDFMVGSAELNVIGVKHDGQKVQILKNGEWAI